VLRHASNMLLLGCSIVAAAAAATVAVQ